MNSHRVRSELDFPEDILCLRVSVLLLTTEGNTRNEIRHFPAENYNLYQIDRHRENGLQVEGKKKVRCHFKRIIYPKMKYIFFQFFLSFINDGKAQQKYHKSDAYTFFCRSSEIIQHTFCEETDHNISMYSFKCLKQRFFRSFQINHLIWFRKTKLFFHTLVLKFNSVIELSE